MEKLMMVIEFLLDSWLKLILRISTRNFVFGLEGTYVI
jgi:hypothetical protein